MIDGGGTIPASKRIGIVITNDRYPENLRSKGSRAASLRALGRARLFRPGDKCESECARFFDCNSAAERHGLSAHGPRAPAHDDGCADASQANVRLSDAVAARNRSRQHLDPIDGNASVKEGRAVAP